MPKILTARLGGIRVVRKKLQLIIEITKFSSYSHKFRKGNSCLFLQSGRTTQTVPFYSQESSHRFRIFADIGTSYRIKNIKPEETNVHIRIHLRKNIAEI